MNLPICLKKNNMKDGINTRINYVHFSGDSKAPKVAEISWFSLRSVTNDYKLIYNTVSRLHQSLEDALAPLEEEEREKYLCTESMANSNNKGYRHGFAVDFIRLTGKYMYTFPLTNIHDEKWNNMPSAYKMFEAHCGPEMNKPSGIHFVTPYIRLGVDKMNEKGFLPITLSTTMNIPEVVEDLLRISTSSYNVLKYKKIIGAALQGLLPDPRKE
jgi:hypothetical protein